tara:strand:+ start:190 stop:1344 length:1155 start_codon:yes stop_codon:yes gene_type:complete
MSLAVPSLWLGLLIAGNNPAFAVEADFSAFLGGEFWDSTTASGHGIVSIRSDFSGLARGSRGYIDFNTDTLNVGLVDINVGEDTVVGLSLKGEAGVSNLLTDYFYEGDNDPSRGFFASYVTGSVWAKFNPADSLYVLVNGSTRRWFFQSTEMTDPNLILPNVSLAIEPEVQVTWWALSDDSAWQHPHRLFPRFYGWAAGLGARGIFFSEVMPWGSVTTDESSNERRNLPSESMFILSQWVLWGKQLGDKTRVEFSENASYMNGEDDLYRSVIGGMSPYSVNVPGVPWGYFHGDDYVAASARIAHRLWSSIDMEVGPVLGAISMRDEPRTGDDRFSSQYGYGLYGDLRVGSWQYELRGGLSPSLGQAYDNQDAWSFFFMCGWSTM